MAPDIQLLNPFSRMVSVDWTSKKPYTPPDNGHGWDGYSSFVAQWLPYKSGFSKSSIGSSTSLTRIDEANRIVFDITVVDGDPSDLRAMPHLYVYPTSVEGFGVSTLDADLSVGIPSNNISGANGYIFGAFIEGNKLSVLVGFTYYDGTIFSRFYLVRAFETTWSFNIVQERWSFTPLTLSDSYDLSNLVPSFANFDQHYRLPLIGYDGHSAATALRYSRYGYTVDITDTRGGPPNCGGSYTQVISRYRYDLHYSGGVFTRTETLIGTSTYSTDSVPNGAGGCKQVVHQPVETGLSFQQSLNQEIVSDYWGSKLSSFPPSSLQTAGVVDANGDYLSISIDYASGFPKATIYSTASGGYTNSTGYFLKEFVDIVDPAIASAPPAPPGPPVLIIYSEGAEYVEAGAVIGHVKIAGSNTQEVPMGTSPVDSTWYRLGGLIMLCGGDSGGPYVSGPNPSDTFFVYVLDAGTSTDWKPVFTGMNSPMSNLHGAGMVTNNHTINGSHVETEIGLGR